MTRRSADRSSLRRDLRKVEPCDACGQPVVLLTAYGADDGRRRPVTCVPPIDDGHGHYVSDPDGHVAVVIADGRAVIDPAGTITEPGLIGDEPGPPVFRLRRHWCSQYVPAAERGADWSEGPAEPAASAR